MYRRINGRLTRKTGMAEEMNAQLLARLQALEMNQEQGPRAASVGRPTIFSHSSSVGNPRSWIDKYHLYAQTQRWNNQGTCNYLKMFLSGIAEIWFDNLDDETKQNWDNLRTAFIQKFIESTPKWSLESKLLQRVHQAGESIEAYLNDVSLQCSRLEIGDGEHLRIIIRGMSPKMRSHVLSHSPVNVADVERLAKLYESIESDDKPIKSINAINPDNQFKLLIDKLDGQNQLLQNMSDRVEILERQHQDHDPYNN